MSPNPNKLLHDFELLDLLRSGDENALTLIYKKYWQPLFTSSYNILKDKQACEDIIQELFITLWNNRQTIEITISLKAYLYASMRYAVYRQIRSGAVRTEIFDGIQQIPSPASYGNIEYKELLSQINSVVNTLPEKCKEVYKLSREEYLSHKEIANRLNISTKTVENHLTKALRQLRTSLGTLFLAILAILLFIK